MRDNNPCESDTAEVSGRSWPRIVGLGALPIILTLAVYYLQAGPGSIAWQLRGDQVFYEYQMARMAEVGGQFWKIPNDLMLGWPSSVRGRQVSPPARRVRPPADFDDFRPHLQRHHQLSLLVLSVIAINGWIAGGLTFRLTRSTLWAAASIVLITLNCQVAGRMRCHLHLFKFGWFLLATWVFWRYLEAPSRRARGCARAGGRVGASGPRSTSAISWP